MTKSKAQRIEQTAAWAVMRADRRFLWFWLAVASSMSLGANIGHAWLTQTSTPFGLRIAAAVMAPVLLLMAIHGLPTLARMLDREERDPLLTIVVWGVVIGAFAWSAVGIFHFAVSSGIPPQLAWIAPFTIDLSVFGATRALVLTTPIAARMKQQIADDAAPAPAPRAASPTPRNAAPATHRATSVPAPEPTAEAVRADAMIVLPAAPISPPAEAISASRVRESQVSEVVSHRGESVAASPVEPIAEPDESPVVTQEHLDLAARLKQREGGTVAKPVEDIALILAYMDMPDISERQISARTGWSTNTISKLRGHLAKLPQLTAVG
jgi:hypothetical protein